MIFKNNILFYILNPKAWYSMTHDHFSDLSDFCLSKKSNSRPIESNCLSEAIVPHSWTESLKGHENKIIKQRQPEGVLMRVVSVGVRGRYVF